MRLCNTMRCAFPWSGALARLPLVVRGPDGIEREPTGEAHAELLDVAPVRLRERG